MAAIPNYAPDPTLEAADRALEEAAKREPRRAYLGMSSIGTECERKLWYNVHDPVHEKFNAVTLKRFDDGHRSEDIMAARLRMAPGVELWTVDEDGKQFGCYDMDGRFKGHMDGVVRGLHQDPETPHVWEGKATKTELFRSFQKLKIKHGEKAALEQWNYVYWCQAQAYMGYFELTRHYITVCTPGVREWDSARTEFDPVAFERIKDKASRILASPSPLAKLSTNPTWHVCRMCVYHSRCHGGT